MLDVVLIAALAMVILVAYDGFRRRWAAPVSDERSRSFGGAEPGLVKASEHPPPR